MKSTFLNLNSADFLKGLIVAVITAVISVVYTTLQSGVVIINWKDVTIAAATAALAYITKNLLTNSTDQFLTKEK